MAFDEKKDGVDRCVAFIEALHAIMKEHRVTVAGHSLNLTQVELCHDDSESGWRLDMRDVQSLTDHPKCDYCLQHHAADDSCQCADCKCKLHPQFIERWRDGVNRLAVCPDCYDVRRAAVGSN